jgi:hypothetical protein
MFLFSQHYQYKAKGMLGSPVHTLTAFSQLDPNLTTELLIAEYIYFVCYPAPAAIIFYNSWY